MENKKEKLLALVYMTAGGRIAAVRRDEKRRGSYYFATGRDQKEALSVLKCAPIHVGSLEAVPFVREGSGIFTKEILIGF